MGVRVKRVFDFLSDPGHGWLKVPRDLIIDLDIECIISGFSYQFKDNVYLEEDRDAGIFHVKYTEKYGEYRELNKYTNNQSRVRNYDHYEKEV